MAVKLSPMENVEGKLPFEGLVPELILDAVDSAGLRTDGRLLALNSYENRVYEVGIEEGEPLVAKFYRPGRWSDEAILEEHSFTMELAEHEVPVVPPLLLEEGITLLEYEGFRFALFNKQPGRTPELEDEDTLKWMGRFMGRIHAVGKTRRFVNRPALNPGTFGDDSVNFVLEKGFVPSYLEKAYKTLAEEILRRVREGWGKAGIDPEGSYGIRLHGDCHPGNILWTREGPHFVDFDDCRTGPAIQDLWMLISGNRSERQEGLDYVLEGYSGFADLNPKELFLIEPLRALRMLNHSAWLARRWEDPAFKTSFPWFDTPKYWEEQILSLREQAALMDEPPLDFT
jgi:Ser/Thr protein kinase RdoA (MazF antagonist)